MAVNPRPSYLQERERERVIVRFEMDVISAGSSQKHHRDRF